MLPAKTEANVPLAVFVIVLAAGVGYTVIVCARWDTKAIIVLRYLRPDSFEHGMHPHLLPHRVRFSMPYMLPAVPGLKRSLLQISTMKDTP